MLPNPESIVERLMQFQAAVRDKIISSRNAGGLSDVKRSHAADTIYKIDTEIDPILESFMEDWGGETPLVLVAEGLEDEAGDEVQSRIFPRGAKESDAKLRIIVDPIDGTRGIMYDKRAAWALAGVAPNKGAGTRLRDIEVAVMTELPTSKMGQADVLWAIKGGGAKGIRVDLKTGRSGPLKFSPSQASVIDHGFVSVANFFPGTKVLSSELLESVVASQIGPADVTRATVFVDQYISTGGQFYELIVGHDLFNADVRPIFYRIQDQPEGLCCHPYDCATLLVAEEAGVIITDAMGAPLDGPFDVTTGISWAGFANQTLRGKLEPVLRKFLKGRLKK
jgi:hypothetical protein